MDESFGGGGGTGWSGNGSVGSSPSDHVDGVGGTLFDCRRGGDL